MFNFTVTCSLRINTKPTNGDPAHGYGLSLRLGFTPRRWRKRTLVGSVRNRDRWQSTCTRDTETTFSSPDFYESYSSWPSEALGFSVGRVSTSGRRFRWHRQQATREEIQGFNVRSSCRGGTNLLLK
jgi:hypothetical protein